MWIFTDRGFFSVVQKPGEDPLTLRARIEGDLGDAMGWEREGLYHKVWDVMHDAQQAAIDGRERS